MQIPIASSLYYTAVVIRRPEIWAPIFIALFLKYKQCFHEIIINNDTNHKNYDTTMSQSYSTYFIKWKAVDFTLALLYLNFKLQYLMNYKRSYFNNFCRFQLLAVCTTSSTVVIRRPEFWGPNFIAFFLKYNQCFMKT